MWPFRKPQPAPVVERPSQAEVLRRLVAEKAALIVELNIEHAMRTKLGELYAKAGAELDETRRLLVEARAEAADLRPYKERADALAREVLAVKADRETQAELIDRAEGSANRANARLAQAERNLAEQEERIVSMRGASELLERELREANATIEGLGFKLATFERAEDAAYEAKAKRLADGQGDER